MALAATAATVKATNRSEFGFLGAYSPTHVLNPGPLNTKPPPSIPDFRCELFYYDRVWAPRVLTALKAELTKAKGYTSNSFTDKKLTYFIFTKGPYPQQVIYCNDNSIVNTAFKDRNLPRVEPDGAVVIVVRGPTWFEAKWSALKKFFRLE